MDLIDKIKNEFEANFEDVWQGVESVVQNSLYNNPTTHCRSTIYTIAKMIKPMSVLEIGSMAYDSSECIAHAMVKTKSWGRIHSLDIRVGGYSGKFKKEPASALITPLYWLPHKTGYDEWKFTAPIEHPEFKNMTNEQIFDKNCELLKFVAPKGGYDMIFIDGDHSYEGVTWDWRYACRFSHSNTVVVIDDMYDDRHYDVRRFWLGLQTKKYDFADWNHKHPEFFASTGVTLTNDPIRS
jgi:predicted O-methyltransferase YrrM